MIIKMKNLNLTLPEDKIDYLNHIEIDEAIGVYLRYWDEVVPIYKHLNEIRNISMDAKSFGLLPRK